MSFTCKPMWIVALLVVILGAYPPSQLLAQTADSPPILITEVVYDPNGDDSRYEWIELKVNRAEPIDIGGFKIGDEESYGGGEGMLRFPADTILEGNRIIVIAQTAAGFQERYGIKPDYEMQESQAEVPNLRPSRLLATGDIALANDGDEVVLLDDKNGVVDAISYGDSSAYLSPSIQTVPSGFSLTRIPANCDRDSAGDWAPSNLPQPYIVSTDPACDIKADPVSDTNNETSSSSKLVEEIFIGDLQGTEETATAVNETVTYEGIVIGRHADTNASGITFHTLYVQGVPDGDEQTSDALPAFLALDRSIAQVGDRVRISGQVTEFYGLSEISNDGIKLETLERQQPLPEPVLLNQARLPDESLEGMLVEIKEGIVAGPTFETAAGCGFAVIPSEFNQSRIIRHRLETDISPIIPVLFHNEPRCRELASVKTGDVIRNLSGPLTWNFDQWKIIVQREYPYEVIPSEMPPLPEVLEPEENQISLVSYNLENLFDGIDDTGDDAEPKLSEEEIHDRIEKFAYTIGKVINCPTVIAIQEVEKESLLDRLSEEAELYCEFRYEVSHIESADVRGIDNAFLTRPDIVTVNQVQLRPTCTTLETGIRDEFGCDDGEDPLFSRPPLQLDATIQGEHFAFFVNHFKSKRGGELETAPRRLAQAEHIRELVLNLEAEPNSPHIVVMGDFNDYGDSPTFQTMTADGQLENLLRRLPDEEAYTFNFSGAAQLLDGILATPGTAAMATHIDILHINADFPDRYQSDTSFQHIGFKSTDHDLPYVILDLSEAIALSESKTIVEEIAEAVAIPDVVEAVDLPQITSDIEASETVSFLESLSATMWGVIGLIMLLAVGLVIAAVRRE